MYQLEKAFEARMLALIALASLINLIFPLLIIHESKEVGRWFLLSEYSPAVSQAPSSIKPIPAIPKAKATIRATLVHWYGPLNYKAMEAWIKYHNVRWGVTHVDIFLPDRRIEEAKIILGQAFNDVVNVSLYSNLIDEQSAQTNKTYRRSLHVRLLFGQALNQSRAENNDFLMNFDADEFLVSDDFDTIADMFAYANRSAVSIPVFNNNYERCSNNNLTFGSVTFQSLRPSRSQHVNDPMLEYYTEPPRACSGNSKYIIRPKFFTELKSPHDPHGCISHEQSKSPPYSDKTYYMTGRRLDHEHVRVNHMRTGLGLFADMTMAACTANHKTCKYLNPHGACTDNFTAAKFINEPNSMNEILRDFPLFPGIVEFSAEAVCYAQRYPSLLEAYCGGNVTQCLYGGLARQYAQVGKQLNMTWGCSPPLLPNRV